MSQSTKLLTFLSDGLAHSTPEILKAVYGNNHLGIARIGARIHDLKQHGHNIISFRDHTKKSIWYYQLKPHDPIQQVLNASRDAH